MRAKETEGLLKIGQLAKASGVNVSTVKYYISQGFIHPSLKTSANMSYYDPADVERIRLIKHLQQTKYYPLSLIRELLNGDRDPARLELWSVIHKIAPAKSPKAVSRRHAAEQTGLSPGQIDALVARGVVTPSLERGRRVFDARSLGVLHLVKKRCDAGLPFEHTLESFAIYSRAMEAAVSADVDTTIRMLIAPGSLSSAAMASMLRTADATLDEFVPLKREHLDAYYSSLRVMEMRDYFAALSRLAGRLPALAQGGPQCRTAAGLMERLLLVKTGTEIVTCGPLVAQALDFFRGMEAGREESEAHRRALLALRLGFFRLAPPMLGLAREAEDYGRSFGIDCAGCMAPAAAAAFEKEVEAMLDEIHAEGTPQAQEKGDGWI